jgi:hypothetical protein
MPIQFGTAGVAATNAKVAVRLYDLPPGSALDVFGEFWPREVAV